MNPELPPKNREELEARVTALLLGELTAEESVALCQIIAQDPELAKFHNRLHRTIDLVRESAVTPAGELVEASGELVEPAGEPVEPLKLSAARREALLARFKTVPLPEQARPRSEKISRIVKIAAAIVIVFIVAGLCLPKLASSGKMARARAAALEAEYAMTAGKAPGSARLAAEPQMSVTIRPESMQAQNALAHGDSPHIDHVYSPKLESPQRPASPNSGKKAVQLYLPATGSADINFLVSDNDKTSLNGAEAVQEMIPLHNLNPTQLSKDLYGRDLAGVEIGANDGGNALIVSGQPADISRFAQKIEALDQGGERDLLASHLTNTDSKEAASQINESFAHGWSNATIDAASANPLGTIFGRGRGGGGARGNSGTSPYADNGQAAPVTYTIDPVTGSIIYLTDADNAEFVQKATEGMDNIKPQVLNKPIGRPSNLYDNYWGGASIAKDTTASSRLAGESLDSPEVTDLGGLDNGPGYNVAAGNASQMPSAQTPTFSPASPANRDGIGGGIGGSDGGFGGGGGIGGGGFGGGGVFSAKAVGSVNVAPTNGVLSPPAAALPKVPGNTSLAYNTAGGAVNPGSLGMQFANPVPSLGIASDGNGAAQNDNVPGSGGGGGSGGRRRAGGGGGAGGGGRGGGGGGGGGRRGGQVAQANTDQTQAFKLNYAGSADVANQLAALFPDPNTQTNQQGMTGRSRATAFVGPGGLGAGGGAASSGMSDRLKKQATVSAVPDPATQTVIVTAPKDQMAQVAEMIAELDGNPAKRQQLYTYRPSHGDVADMYQPLKDLFGSTSTSSSTPPGSALHQGVQTSAQQTAAPQNSLGGPNVATDSPLARIFSGRRGGATLSGSTGDGGGTTGLREAAPTSVAGTSSASQIISGGALPASGPVSSPATNRVASFSQREREIQGQSKALPPRDLPIVGNLFRQTNAPSVGSLVGEDELHTYFTNSVISSSGKAMASDYAMATPGARQHTPTSTGIYDDNYPSSDHPVHATSQIVTNNIGLMDGSELALAVASPPVVAAPAPVAAPKADVSFRIATDTADASSGKRTVLAPIPQPEVLTSTNAFSTFSLNVSDVSFKLAAASLQNGAFPDRATVRSEEFINAFDYRDSEPAPGAPIGFAWERSAYPFSHNRDLLRFSVKTSAEGRQAGRPLNLVLLLDKSGSMERADRVAIIREALRTLAAQLQPQDKFTVIVFARTARLWADGVPGNQAGAVADALSGITPEGGTNLEEAMKLAYEAALRHYLPNGENRVVVLTDGAANLGEVAPDALKKKVEANRAQGVALDCFGIGWEDYNDNLLEVLSRAGGGRYGFVNTPEEAASGFAGQLAGALRVAASDVKVQVEFNPARVISYRQIGYAKDQLAKEQFRDNSVKAAQIGAAESGNALYTVEINPAGDGPLCTVHVRYRDPGTSDYHEHAWDVPYTGAAPMLDQSTPAMRLAATASAFSEWLAASPYAGEVNLDQLLGYMRGVPQFYGADARPAQLEAMLREAKALSGK